MAAEYPPGRVHSCAFDVTSDAEAARGVAWVEENVGPLEILVNNAGIQHRVPMLELDVADWERVISTDLTSAFLVGREAARHMIPRGRGKIINICSVQTDLARPTIAPYIAAKGGLRNLTRAMTAEWAGSGLQINGIAPGYIHTEMTQNLVDDEEFNCLDPGPDPGAPVGDRAGPGRPRGVAGLRRLQLRQRPDHLHRRRNDGGGLMGAQHWHRSSHRRCRSRAWPWWPTRPAISGSRTSRWPRRRPTRPWSRWRSAASAARTCTTGCTARRANPSSRRRWCWATRSSGPWSGPPRTAPGRRRAPPSRSIRPPRARAPPGIPEDRPNLSPGCTYLGSAARFPHTDGAFSRYVNLPARMLRALPGGPGPADRGAGRAGQRRLARRRPGRGRGGEDGAGDRLRPHRRPGRCRPQARRRGPDRGRGHARQAAGNRPVPWARTRSCRPATPRRSRPCEADVVIESSGSHHGLASAIQGAARGGRVVMVGLLPSGPAAGPDLAGHHPGTGAHGLLPLQRRNRRRHRRPRRRIAARGPGRHPRLSPWTRGWKPSRSPETPPYPERSCWTSAGPE